MTDSMEGTVNADLTFGVEDLGCLLNNEVIVFTEYGDDRHFGRVRFRNPSIRTNLADVGPSLYWAVSEDGVPQSSHPASGGNPRRTAAFRFRLAGAEEIEGMQFSYEDIFK